ncbi:MAG: tetratricopeptide repeat protein [Oceanicaulis sp.]
MTAGFDLDAELAAGREDAKRQVERERTGAGKAIAAALESGAAGKAPSPKAVGLVRRAVRTMDEGHAAAAKAAKLCLKAIDMEPDFALAHQAMALCLERLGRLSSALGFYQRAYDLDPRNADLYLNLGMLAWKLDMLDTAETFLRLHTKMAPHSMAGTSNLAGLLRDQQKYADSIEILRAAIYANPDSPDLWNSLGTTLLESGDLHQAATFYQEALRLNPDFDRAHHNLAYCLDLMGDLDAAVSHFRTALSLGPTQVDKTTMEHGLSLTLLAAGRFEDGWALYESRLSPHYKHSVHFHVDAPRWDGLDPEALKGKRVLVVGEQGLGDEVAFASLLPDIIKAAGPDGEVALACERRLAPLFQRSFPGLEIVNHSTAQREGRTFRVTAPLAGGPPQIWLAPGTAHRAFRQSRGDFPARPHLAADPERVAALRETLAGFGAGPKVGLLWKSLKMNANRSKYFASFDAWRPLIETAGVTFVNMQYGDVADDLAEVKRVTGVEIKQVEGLDLKDDLEGLTALGAALDLTVGPMNASSSLTAAAGGRVWLLHGSPAPWTLLGSDEVLWYPGSRSFTADTFGAWGPLLRTVADELAEFARRAAAA